MEELLDKGIGAIADNVSKIYSEIKEEVKYFRRENINKYLGTFVAKFRNVKTILHGVHPKPFYEVYQPLRVRIQRRTVPNYDSKTIFSGHNFLTLTGDAGSGKSMLFKHLFMDSIVQANGIPIFVELRNVNESGQSIEDFINSIVSTHITASSRVRERLLERGDFVFFLDGFDEVKKDLKAKTIQSICGIQEKYPKNRMVISTRPYTNIEMLPNFLSISVVPMSNEEIISFTRRQISEAELAERIVQSIAEARKNNAIMTFLQNPLLLSLYILTYQNSSEIPNKVSLFYRRVVDALFIEHDSKSKIGFQRERASKITFDRFESVMKKFSLVSFFDEKFAFDIEYARKLISKILETEQDSKFTADELIEDLKLAFSLWVEDGGLLSFAHRSLQEYFCAIYIRDAPEKSRERIYSKVSERMRRGFASDMFKLLSILSEVDNHYYNKNYLIPMLTELSAKVEACNSPFDLALVFFAYFNRSKSETQLQILPSGYKYLMLLDSQTLGYKFFMAVKAVLESVEKPTEQFEVAKKSPGVFLKNAKPQFIVLLNGDKKCLELSEEIKSFVSTELHRVGERLVAEKRQDEDILSLLS